MWYPGDSLFLDELLSWLFVITHPGSHLTSGARKLKKVMGRLLLGDLDTLAIGGSGLLKNDSPFQIGVMEKEAQTSIMHKG
jgi:hypothetical protein